MHFLLRTILFFLTSFLPAAHAVSEKNQTIIATIPIYTSLPNGLLKAANSQKEVFLMKMNLTDAEKKNLLQQTITPSFKSAANLKKDNLPSFIKPTITLPVLDQGRHGSCVTFANTAAIDVLLGKGDYVSQLCNLELGYYLSKRSNNEFIRQSQGGWDGSLAPYVLNQMMQFGFVNKNVQQTKRCANVNAYPLNNENDTGAAISLDEFEPLSESLFPKIYWQSILDFSQRQDPSALNPYHADEVLIAVKKALAFQGTSNIKKVSVTFGTFLPSSHCHAGACATYHKPYDTWAFTAEIKNDPDSWYKAGHEMFIIGYDDNAIATDNQGKKYTGLLILRNSWGSNAGDNGNYYMTYDFFKNFIMEAQVIVLRDLNQ